MAIKVLIRKFLSRFHKVDTNFWPILYIRHCKKSPSIDRILRNPRNQPLPADNYTSLIQLMTRFFRESIPGSVPRAEQRLIARESVLLREWRKDKAAAKCNFLLAFVLIANIQRSSGLFFLRITSFPPARQSIIIWKSPVTTRRKLQLAAWCGLPSETFRSSLSGA